MGVPRTLPVVVGFATLIATSAILIIHIILCGHIQEPDNVRISASVSAALEGVVLSVLTWLFSTYFIVAIPDRSKRFLGIAFGVSVITCTLATVSSIVTMIYLNASRVSTSRVLEARLGDYMIGACVALSAAFSSQLAFIVIHFVLARIPGHGAAHSLHTTEEEPVSQVEVKTVRYDQTSPYPLKPANMSRPSGSSSGKSASDTIDSIRRSISSVAKPLSTRMHLTRERSSTSTSNGIRERETAPEDGFDSWDTSAVDPQNRQTVMQSTSPTGRFLETIPASPTASRSSSSSDSFALDPPQLRTRSRSYSPAGGRVPRAPYATQSDGTEAHIHPLFRSDSPTPPPAATPGTMVMASPNAGQVISDRQSIRSLSRMRSGSLPAAPSPLSRQGSFDEFAPLRPSAREREGTTPTPSISEAPEEDERKLTPPIPEWILTAGTRTSMSDYTRRLKSRGEE